MKKQLLMIVLLVVIGATAYIAHDKYHDHSEKIEHYEGQKPTSIASALAILNNEAITINKILEKPKLDNNDLEAIHLSSYSLESAVDYLEEQGEVKSNIAVNAIIKKLDDIVDKIHDASEDHKEDITRKSFDEFKMVNDNLQKIF